MHSVYRIHQDYASEDDQILHTELGSISSSDILRTASTMGHEDPFWHYVEGGHLLV